MMDLPDGWSEASGMDIFDLIRGVSYQKQDAHGQSADGLVPILRANNIQDASIVTDDLVFVPKKYVSRDQMLRPGDVVVATSSGSRHIVGKTAAAGEKHTNLSFGAFCAVAR